MKSMVKVNELRIGNLVINPGIDYDQGENKYHDPDGDVVCAVEAFSKEYIELKEVVSGVFLEEKHIDQCLPIPLSPEWLERCGFKIKHETSEEEPLTYSILKMDLDIAREEEGYYLRYECQDSYYDSNIGTPILYLHQLQNLYFALTGEELNVKL